MKNSIKKKRTGNKHDHGKVPVTQFLRQFPNALIAVARVSEYGHNKYGEKEDAEHWDNWKHVEDAKFRYKQAFGRHFLEANGTHDDESGFPHILHTIWNGLAMVELEILEAKNKQNKT